MELKIHNAINNTLVPAWGNKKKYIAVHYVGSLGDCHALRSGGYGTHFYIHRDGTVYQACSLDAVPWQVGTAGTYKQLHPHANNYNCIGIEMCCYNDVNSKTVNGNWYFSKATQEACVLLVQHLMQQLNIDASHVLRHGDIVSKTCPAPYMYNNGYKGTWTWTQFMDKVKNNSGWRQNSTGWWYKNSDGTWPAACWQKISGEWYYFNEDGYALQNKWFKDGDYWYFLDNDCKMVTGWLKRGNNWYYLRPSREGEHPTGSMLTGWVKDGGRWYYLTPEETNEYPEGAMVKGWLEWEGDTYYLRPQKEGDYPEGSMVTGTYVIGEAHVFDASGIMIK